MTQNKNSIAVGTTTELKPKSLFMETGKDQTYAQNIRKFKKAQEISPIKIHDIYDSVLNCLSNPMIRHIETGKTLPFVLHSECKTVSNHRLESEIVEYAENYSRKYEVWRRMPRELCEKLQRENKTDALFDLRIVPLPNWLLNCFICESLLKRFSRRELLACPGFIEIETTDEKGIIRKRIEMDISENLIRRGFMLPIFKDGLICALEIYRNISDNRPFELRTRFGGLNK